MKPTRIWLFLGALAVGTLLGWGDGRAQDAPDPDACAVDDPADDADSEWPREIDAGAARIVVYQPQLDAYANGVIEAHSALAITADGAEEPVFGAVWFKAKMEVDRDARVCEIYDVEVPRARFTDSTPETEQKLAGLIRQVVPGWVHPISMDRLLPALEALELKRANDDRLRNDAPRIVVETVPAMLVPIDGEAKLVDVAGSRIRRVVNTPVALLFEPTTKTYWIDGGAAWIYASNVDGPYRTAVAAPPEIAAVKTSNDGARAAAPAPGTDAGAAPKIVVSHEPTELIAFDGEPQWSTLVGDDLSYATNTANAVFSLKSQSRFYVLLSGRWFRSTSLTAGSWDFVAPDDLPDCFAAIPEDSEMGGVLAHVAGTELANEAILDAQIPHTTAVRRIDANTNVAYDGPPRFEQIPGTDIRYAVNTASQVLLYEDRYYFCDQGVWYTCLSGTGPWSLADDVPPAFQQIPPENPCYNVKYVYVYDATPDVVYVGYTPGYLGWYCSNGAVVWGTGWRYPCWSGGYWYPRCATWGVSVGYNAWSGGWYAGLSYGWGGGWSVGIGVYDGWGKGGAWWGPCGYRDWHHHDGGHHDDHRRPACWSHGFDRDGHGGGQRHTAGLYDSVRNRARGAPDRIASRPVSRWPATPARPATPRPSRPRNDVYVDRDGGVYRRAGDGSWHRREGTQWRPAPAPRTPAPRTPAPPRGQRPERPQVQRPPVRPAPTPQLGRDAWARDRGNVRTHTGDSRSGAKRGR